MRPGRDPDRVSSDLHEGLDKALIVCPSSHCGHLLFYPYPLHQTVNLGGKGPVYPRKEIFFSDPFGDP